jgi:hypothetical protein
MTRLANSICKELTIKQLTALYNQKADRKIKKFDSKDKAAIRIGKLLDEKLLYLTKDLKHLKPLSELYSKEQYEKVTGQEYPQPKKRSGRYSPDQIITVLREHPIKRGSKRNPYEHYKSDMTVQEALNTGVITSRDLNWDAKEDRPGGAVIEINDPKERK